MAKPVCIKVYDSVALAELSKNLLEGYGIKAFVVGGSYSSSYPSLAVSTGVQLFVSQTDKKEALNIIQ
jgi:hypothetical protein